MLGLALFWGSIGGLVVASILRRLDNIVKEYAGCLANVGTAVVCSVLFPDKFAFTAYIIASLLLLLLGIYLYESGKRMLLAEKKVK